MTSGRQKKREQVQRRHEQPPAPGVDPENAPPSIPVNSKRLIYGVVSFCLVVEILFVILDATINYAEWSNYGMFRRMFNIAREDGLASWFGTTQTWMIGLTLGLLYIVSRRDQRPRFERFGWALLTAFFLYMAVDDGAEIHERVGSAFKKYHTTYAKTAVIDTYGEKALDAFPSYTWQIVFMPIFGAIGLFMLYFLWRQLESNRARLGVLGAIGLLCAGVGLDFVEGLEDYHEGPDEHHLLDAYAYLIYNVDMENWTRETFNEGPYEAVRHFSKSIEECMEMMAMTIMWGVFLSQLTRVTHGLSFTFSRREDEPPIPSSSSD